MDTKTYGPYDLDSGLEDASDSQDFHTKSSSHDFRRQFDNIQSQTSQSHPDRTPESDDSCSQSSDSLFSQSSIPSSRPLLPNNEFYHTISENCPYQVGTLLELEKDGQQINARIVKVYNGGSSKKFSNSCTVLLNILDCYRQEGLSEEMVLKIIDWRFAATPREKYNCATWDSKRLHNLISLSKDEKTSFEDWLRLNVSEQNRKHELITTLCQYDFIPSMPTHMDLFGYLLSEPTQMVKDFVDQSLIPCLPTVAQEEIFLRTLSQIQLAAEDRIARKINAHLPNRMPRAYGIFNVLVQGQDKIQLDNAFQVQGLLMDQAPGQPIIFYQPAIGQDKEVRSLAKELASLLLEFHRYDLDLYDNNLHNFLLSHGLNGKQHLIAVDYGAISLIVPDYDNPDLLSVQLPFSTNTVQLPKGFYNRFFNCFMERELVGGVVEHLASPTSAIYQDLEPALSRCFEPLVSTNIGRFVWHTTMLHIIHSCYEWVFHNYTSAVLQIIRSASRIMAQEEAEAPGDIWWLRATTRIAELTGSDDIHARKVISFLVDTTGVNYSFTNYPLPLVLVHDLKNQPHPETTGLMFTGLNATLATQFAGKEYKLQEE